MKKTKILVITAVITLGLGYTVKAKLPADSIMIGTTVYNSSYLKNSADLEDINDQLMNNLGSIYYVNDNGKAQDMFTGSVVSDSDLVAKLGNTLTYYTASGTIQKIVANADDEYTDPTSTNTDMYCIVSVTYKTVTTGISMYTVKVSQISGVSNATYFKAGDSAITALTDTTTYIGSYSSGSGILLSIYDSDGLTELANGYINLNQGVNTSGSENFSVILTASAQNPVDTSEHGNTAINLTNNGFAAIDKDGSWIYYENTADGDKLYRKSVTGVDDYVISDDSVQYINVVGDWVYYSNYDDGGKIYKIKTDGTQRQKICDDMASCINVVGDKIYYINNSDRGRIYIYDSQGRRQLLSDSAKYLSVGDNFLFYVNASDDNKLYSCNFLNNYSKLKLSDVNTQFVSAANDYLIFYTGKDGKLYRSVGSYTANPAVLNITTNIPQKSGKTTSLNGVADKATIVCGVDDNDIYYTSYADGKKIYKLDSTGNGYKVVDDSADYINIVGDSLYYMKSGKSYLISKDADGTSKGTAIAKPKLTEKVVSVEPLPSYSTDDISNFNFPEKVSAIMSDGTIRQLVVNWDKDKPKIKAGVYTYTGTILGYGTKVTMTVSLDSGTINPDDITVVNTVGSKDTVTVNLANTEYNPGDIISVYANSSDTKPLKTAVVGSDYKAVLSGLNFDPNGTTIYVTVTASGRAEGSKVSIACPAEAPSGFSVDAQDQEITGLKAGKTYKVYINDENADGSTPDLPSDFLTATADDSGVITVSNMQSKILANADKKQMLRVVLAGNVDSQPSSPVEISQASVPDYVYVDLNLGRIVGSTVGMQYRYSTDDWKDCSGGSTSISLTLSLQVQIKVKANGPVMESEVKTYGLFDVPKVTGLEDGKIYSTGYDSTGKSTFPTVSWNTGTIGSITYTATLAKKDGTVMDNSVTPSTLLTDLRSAAGGNGDYILTVNATKTDNNMSPSSVTNSTVINFTINSTPPSAVDITMQETAGTSSGNTVATYYQATPIWTNLAGTYSTATIKMTKTASGTAGNVTYTDIANPATVAFVQGNTITQNGEYELTVTTTSRENGAVTVTKKTFRVDSVDIALSPDVTGVSNGGSYNSQVAAVITDKPNCTTVSTIMLGGYITPYVSGTKLTVNGPYVLILDTTNNINGNTKETKISFTMNDTSTISSSILASDVDVTNNTSGDDTVKVNESIPYGSTIKVYNAAGSVIGTATNNGPAGSVTVTVSGGFPVNDTSIYVTRTDSGKQESNKTQVSINLIPTIKSVSPTTFTENLTNDGSVSGTASDGTSTNILVLEIQNGTIKDSIAKADVTASNLPSGLDYTVTKLDDTHVGISITGKATANEISNSVSNVTFTIKSSALTSSTGGTVSDITTTPITIDFNTATSAVTNVKYFDISNNNNGSDLQVTFDKASDESKVGSYRVIVVKSSKTIDLSAANALAAAKYTSVSKTGSNLEVRLSGSATDSDGDTIANGSYKVYVLTVADGTNANLNALSAPISVTLDNTNVITPVVTVTAASTAGGDSYVNSAEKTSGFNVVAQSNTANSTLYVVPSGTANTSAAITAASIGSAQITAANTNTTIQIPANSAKVTDGTSYVVYAVDPAGTASAPVAAFAADLSAPTATLPSSTGSDNNATTLVVTFNSPLYINGSPVANGADIKSSFTASSGVTISTAIYDPSTYKVTFTLTGASNGSTITHNSNSTKLTDAAGNAYAAKVYTYSQANTSWSSN